MTADLDSEKLPATASEVGVVGSVSGLVKRRARAVFWTMPLAPMVCDFAHNVTHNAGSQLSRNSPNSRHSPPYVVFGKGHKYNILWLTSLTKTSEFHLYYDI